jgi:hypothetical protein
MPDLELDWIYRFTVNDNFPDPLEEIDALCSLDALDEKTYLMLANRSSPPLSGASEDDVVGLCTSDSNGLILHALANVAGNYSEGSTPVSVQPIYGDWTNRVFCPLRDLERLPSKPLPESMLSHSEQMVFLNGQSFVKSLLSTSHRKANSKSFRRSKQIVTCELPIFPSMAFNLEHEPFCVSGLDPTAGTWESLMTSGPKRMPSVVVHWNGRQFEIHKDNVDLHLRNESYWSTVDRFNSVMNCIDGPCATNGPTLRRAPNQLSWDQDAQTRTRGGELELSRHGIHLFWTTQNTVTKFDGASRWIARSLVLFSERPNETNIETHPHGAFTFLWRMLGGTGSLPKKSHAIGRSARIEILRTFIPALPPEVLPDHDAVDAACAALVAGLHVLGLTVPFGTQYDGGQIWMPDIDKLQSLIVSV